MKSSCSTCEDRDVDSMTSGVDCFGPIVVQSLVLIKHCSCHVNECSILPLNHPILFEGYMEPRIHA